MTNNIIMQLKLFLTLAAAYLNLVILSIFVIEYFGIFS